MAIRVAINGYGRIGRNVLRACYNANITNDIQIVAINDLGDVNINAHLTQYDTTHGQFNSSVSVDGDHLIIDGQRIRCLSERDPSACPWGEMNIDVVYECTGLFASSEKAAMHLNAGAKKVLVSAPAGSDVKTVVYGVNHSSLTRDDVIVSNASCTTNCLAPLVMPLHNAIGIEQGLMTTIHAYTNDQKLTDVYHNDVRRARSATQSMIPTKTGAAAAVGLVLPELAGKLDGFAVRVPTLNVSLVDLTFTAKRETTIEEINKLLSYAADNELRGILSVNQLPLVSVDFNGNNHSSVYDASLTKIMGNQVKVCAWYDNETGFSHRMLDTSIAMMSA